MTHFAGLDDKKALNLWDTCADIFIKSEGDPSSGVVSYKKEERHALGD